MIYENVCMITSLQTKRISAISQWKTFIRILPTIWQRKLTRIEIASLSPYVCLTPMRLSDKVVLNAYSPLKLAYSYLSCQKDTASQLLWDVCINAAVLHSQPVCPTRTHASLIQLGGVSESKFRQIHSILFWEMQLAEMQLHRLGVQCKQCEGNWMQWHN